MFHHSLIYLILLLSIYLSIWCKRLKLMDQFTYLASSISSTESDVSIRLAKAGTTVDRLSVIWKPEHSDEITQDFFQPVSVSILQYGYTTWMLTKRIQKRTRWELHKNAVRCLEQILKATHHKTTAVGPLNSHLTNHSSKTNKTCGTLQEKHGRTHKQRCLMDSYTWTP